MPATMEMVSMKSDGQEEQTYAPEYGYFVEGESAARTQPTQLTSNAWWVCFKAVVSVDKQSKTGATGTTTQEYTAAQILALLDADNVKYDLDLAKATVTGKESYPVFYTLSNSTAAAPTAPGTANSLKLEDDGVFGTKLTEVNGNKLGKSYYFGMYVEGNRAQADTTGTVIGNFTCTLS